MDEDFRGRLHRNNAQGQVRPPQQHKIMQAGQPVKSFKRQSPRFKRRSIIIAIVVLAIVLIAGGIVLWKVLGVSKPSNAQTKDYFPASITTAQVNIPVYYPENLPGSFNVGSFSVVQKNILYYVVTNSSGDKFYVTIQALPVSFDFVGFAKKFAQPDQYSTPIGSVLVGVAGGELIGSVQTSQNVWIILNSSAVGSQKDMETITRALRQVSL